MNLTHFYDFWHQKLLHFLFSHTPYTNNYYSLNFSKTNPSTNRKSLFFISKDFFEAIFLIISWWKARLLYYLNNWVYTTNHKRIAINYFWFVILSGIVGMVLATVIRLELAYPGAGIFAGDSLQYLSLVTAHGVVMVFFMIMPLLFGAFANFLLPTQLGVHDVAFPRLNSAAFWFLPSGLIMLAQLICVDRRYQRMNCFNIREVQALLKRKFFADLVNSNDYRNFLNDTMLGVRYRVQSASPINSNFLLFYNYGTNINPKSRSTPLDISFFKTTPDVNIAVNSFFFNRIAAIKTNNFFSPMTDFYLSILEYSEHLIFTARENFKNSSDPLVIPSITTLNFFKNKKNSIFLHFDPFISPLLAANFFLVSLHYYFLLAESGFVKLESDLLNTLHGLIKSPLLAYTYKNIDFQIYLTPTSFSEFFWVKNYELPLIWTDMYFANLFFNAQTANDFIRALWLSVFDYPSTFPTHCLAITVRLEIFFKTLDLYFYNFSSIATFFAKSVLGYLEYPLIRTVTILIIPFQTITDYYYRFEEFYMWYHLKHFKEGITLKEIIIDKFYKKLNETENLKHLEAAHTFSNYLWEWVVGVLTLNLEPIDSKIHELATFDYLDETKLKWTDVWVELNNEINEGVRTYLTDEMLNNSFRVLKSNIPDQILEWLSPLNEIKWLIINLFIFIKNSVVSSPFITFSKYSYDPFSNTHYFFFPHSFYFFFFKDLHPYDIYPSAPLSWEIIRETETFLRLNGGILNVFYNLIKTVLNLLESALVSFFNMFYYGVFITLSNTIVSCLTLESIPITLDRDFLYIYFKKFKTLLVCLWEYVSAPLYSMRSNIIFFWTELNYLPFHFIGFYQTFNMRIFFFFLEDFFLHDGKYIFYVNFINFTRFGTISIFIKNLKTFSTCLIFNSNLGDIFFSIPFHLKSFWILFFKYISTRSTFLNNKFSFKSDYFSSLNLKTADVMGGVENAVEDRHHKSQSPIFKYDYKAGDYFPKLYKEIHTHLFTTASTLTGGFRQAPWFASTSYLELFSDDAIIAISNVKKVFNPWKTIHFWTPIRVNGTASFYNFFFDLFNNNMFYNLRWVSKNVLNQKFYRMFNTSSIQQRIYTNWRNLKFTREAWRCKLLSARHQKTLFRRYVNEDNVFWSIERNARDLLPGWAMITPFSSRTRFTAIGKVDIGLLAVLLVLNSSLISSANFLVTYRYLSTLNNRKMRDARSFFTEAIMVTSWMMIAANPMLVIGIIMLLSDRHWQTSFFDYSGGGDTVLFQHMFWFFGHPEVYIIIIPVFGFTNTILSYYLKKRISARASLLYSMYTIAFLGFFVWGHHMYMVGLSHTTRMLFSTLTVMISVPAATKLMHWCVTIVNSAITLELPLICILTFIFFFISGGISGMFVAHTGMDVLFHDTFYVIGHFHVMLAGAAMIGCFGAFYFYFPAIFGVKYNRIYAYLHYVYYLLGQLFTLIPMFWLGYAGMPRRVLDYPTSFGGWHSLISGGHMLSVAGMLAFFLMIFDSIRQGKAATRTTFGVGRYNTRLNFYIYEIARLTYVQQKGWSFYRRFHDKSLKLNALYYPNLENLETTLYSYVFIKLPRTR